MSLLEFVYNKRPHKVTCLSPFEMNYGMNPTFLSIVRSYEKCLAAAKLLTNIQANIKIAQAKLQQFVDRA